MPLLNGVALFFIYSKTNDYTKTINQPVILSGEKRLRFAQSNFCGLSVSERAKARDL